MPRDTLFNSPLTRRGLLKGSAAAGAAAWAGTGLLPIGSAWAQTPKKGGQLRIAYSTPVDTLDPMAAASSTSQTLSGMLFDNLITFGPDQRTLIPQLALSWKPEKSGQEWVVELRQGVKFHHGKEFGADDVVATVMRSIDKARAARAYRTFGPVADVKAEGPHTVRFIMEQPFSDFPPSCCTRWSRILPADKIDNLATDPVGTGPFVLAEHKQGISTSIKRNENYWDAGRPHLDSVVLLQVSESVAQQAALRANSVDVVCTMGVETYLALKDVSGITAYSRPSGLYQVGFTLAQIDPFKDQRVRLAFKHLIDRKALLQSALLGQGVVGNDLPLRPDDPAVAGFPQHDQDLPKAKALLEAAGVKNLKLDIWTTSERPPSPRMALAFKDGATKIGVDLTVRDITYAEYTANVPRKQPLFTANWSEFFSNFQIFYLSYHSKGAYNYSGMETAPGLDAVIEDIIANVDPVKQKELVNKALTLIHDNSDRVIPYFLNYFAATRSAVKGYNPVEILDIRDIWLDA